MSLPYSNLSLSCLVSVVTSTSFLNGPSGEDIHIMTPGVFKPVFKAVRPTGTFTRDQMIDRSFVSILTWTLKNFHKSVSSDKFPRGDDSGSRRWDRSRVTKSWVVTPKCWQESLLIWRESWLLSKTSIKNNYSKPLSALRLFLCYPLRENWGSVVKLIRTHFELNQVNLDAKIQGQPSLKKYFMLGIWDTESISFSTHLWIRCEGSPLTPRLDCRNVGCSEHALPS